MRSLRVVIVVLLCAVCTSVAAMEAPPDMQKFNVTCPAAKLLPVLDAAYHECNNGFVKGSCEKFVETFRQLLPEYDCQRSFDSTPTKNYIVPAIWLAGDGALEDYVRLLWRMASSKDKMFRNKWFQEATAEAKRLFGSEEFRNILDGALAEEYMSRSEEVERQLKHQATPARSKP
jgi:hypothetical protein